MEKAGMVVPAFLCVKKSSSIGNAEGDYKANNILGKYKYIERDQMMDTGYILGIITPNICIELSTENS